MFTRRFDTPLARMGWVLFVFLAALVPRWAAASLADVPLGALVRERLTTPYASDRAVIRKLESASQRLMSKSLDANPARAFMSADFFNASGPWAQADRAAFAHLMARLGLPTRLTPADLLAFDRNPADSLFAPIESLVSLNKSIRFFHEMHFVVDAIRILSGPEASRLAGSIWLPRLQEKVGDLIMTRANVTAAARAHAPMKAAPARRAPLDLPLLAVLNARVPSHLASDDETLARLGAVSRENLGGGPSDVSTRRYLEASFLDLLGPPKAPLRIAFRALLARAALPTGLTPSELALFEENPDHPLFAPAAVALGMSQTTALSYGVYFAVDAVKAVLDPHGFGFRRFESFKERKRTLERFLNVRIEELALESARSTADPERVAACVRALIPFTDDEVRAALAKRQSRSP